MMDILTPKGQITVEQEKAAIRIFLERYRDFSYVETPKDKPADIDGFITKGSSLISGVEVKCRNMTLKDLMEKFEGNWLITHDKLERGINLCRRLGIDFRGFLYLVPEQTLLVVKIWDETLQKVCDMHLETRKTQATVNGGVAYRLNAYIPMDHAHLIRND